MFLEHYINKSNEVFKVFSVYKLTSPNGKRYIGMTSTNPVKRWAGGHGYECNKEFWKDIVKYGWDHIRREIVLTTENENEAHEKEIELILFYETTNPDLGYNKKIISNKINSSKRVGVTCVNTNRKFRSIKKASLYANTYPQSIKEVCENKREFAGYHPKTGQRLRWKYTAYKYK